MHPTDTQTARAGDSASHLRCEIGGETSPERAQSPGYLEAPRTSSCILQLPSPRRSPPTGTQRHRVGRCGTASLWPGYLQERGVCGDAPHCLQAARRASPHQPTYTQARCTQPASSARVHSVGSQKPQAGAAWQRCPHSPRRVALHFSARTHSSVPAPTQTRLKMIRGELFEFRRKWILLELPFAESHSLPRAVSRLLHHAEGGRLPGGDSELPEGQPAPQGDIQLPGEAQEPPAAAQPAVALGSTSRPQQQVGASLQPQPQPHRNEGSDPADKART